LKLKSVVNDKVKTIGVIDDFYSAGKRLQIFAVLAVGGFSSGRAGI